MTLLISLALTLNYKCFKVLKKYELIILKIGR